MIDGGRGGARGRGEVRAAACGDAVATRNSGSTSPLLCLSARDVEGKGRGPKLNRVECHRSRALATPGTFDSSFPGGIIARDLCAAINAAVSPFAA